MILVAQPGVVDGTYLHAGVEMVGVGPERRQILDTRTPETELAGMIFERPAVPDGWDASNASRTRLNGFRSPDATEDASTPEAACTDASTYHIQERHGDNGRRYIEARKR